MSGPRDNLPQPTYLTTILGNGEICPISEVVGRRRLRHIQPDSVEGRELLRSGRVIILARDGRRFSGTPIEEVFDTLAEDVSRSADDPTTPAASATDLDQLLATLENRRRAYS